MLPKFVPIEQRGMSVSEHLIYLAQLTAAIDAAQSEDENMIDTIMQRDEDEGPIDLPEDDIPEYDEDEDEIDPDDPGPSDEDYIPTDDSEEDVPLDDDEGLE